MAQLTTNCNGVPAFSANIFPVKVYSKRLINKAAKYTDECLL